MSYILFDIDKEKDLKYVKELFKEKTWFEREQFPIYLPKKESVIESEIKQNKKYLGKNIKWLKAEWKKIEKPYFKAIKKFKYQKIINTYTCHVSYFGVEGRYRAPHQLFIRLHNERDKKRVLETIAHELLHLIFNNYFIRNHCTYREREWLIDQIIIKSELKKLFPLYKEQTIGKPKPRILKKLFNI